MVANVTGHGMTEFRSELGILTTYTAPFKNIYIYIILKAKQEHLCYSHSVQQPDD